MILLFSYNLKIDVSLAPVCFSHFKGLADGLVAKSCLTLVTPWTVARQAPLSKGFPRQDYWSGLPFPSSGNLPDPGMEPISPVLAGRFFTTDTTWEAVMEELVSEICFKP